MAMLCFCLYSYIDGTNHITELRIKVPQLKKETRELEEKSADLLYRIEEFEDPAHLLELARQPQFGHLCFPQEQQLLILEGDGF